MLSRMTKLCTEILRMDRASLFVKKMVQNYAEAFQLQYSALLAGARIDDIEGDMMVLQYVPKQSRCRAFGTTGSIV